MYLIDALFLLIIVLIVQSLELRNFFVALTLKVLLLIVYQGDTPLIQRHFLFHEPFHLSHCAQSQHFVPVKKIEIFNKYLIQTFQFILILTTSWTKEINSSNRLLSNDTSALT